MHTRQNAAQPAQNSTRMAGVLHALQALEKIGAPPATTPP